MDLHADETIEASTGPMSMASVGKSEDLFRSHSPYQWSRQELGLFLGIFVIGLLARGLALGRGFSVDDYSFLRHSYAGGAENALAQARLGFWLIARALEKLGVQVIDANFFFGISASIMLAALAVYAIRYVGLLSLPTAIACGGIFVSHPYLGEIYYFNGLTVIYTFILLCIIASLEIARLNPFTWKSFVWVNVFISLALATYQITLNYVFAIAISGVLAALLCQPVSTKESRNRLLSSLFLVACMLASSLIHLFSLRIFRQAGIIGEITSRSNMIESGEILHRIKQAIDLLHYQFLQPEPILAEPLKKAVFTLITIALILILLKLIKIYGWLKSSFIFLVFLVIWLLASVGIVIALREWYLPPRVFTHQPAMIGLLLLNTFNYALPRSSAKRLQSTGCALCAGIIFVYALVGNQIAADRLRINHWDAMLANRIAGRLESLPKYHDVRKIIIYGGAGSFRGQLKTSQLDLNISAFSKDWSKMSILSEATGIKIESESGASPAREKCKSFWPEIDSIFIRDTTAIVCLPD